MKSILFTELTPSEQEALQGGVNLGGGEGGSILPSPVPSVLPPVDKLVPLPTLPTLPLPTQG